ncbi:xylosyltransferase 1-like, partial [Trifolium medium]|nr:xylosyltransferase 1-like [Trifolium medium]
MGSSTQPVELRVKELEVSGSSPDKEKTNISMYCVDDAFSTFYCILSMRLGTWDNFPRIVLMYYANFLSSPERYFHTII